MNTKSSHPHLALDNLWQRCFCLNPKNIWSPTRRTHNLAPATSLTLVCISHFIVTKAQLQILQIFWIVETLQISTSDRWIDISLKFSKTISKKYFIEMVVLPIIKTVV